MRGAGRLRQVRDIVQKGAYRAFALEGMLEREEKTELVQAMGFEGQWEEHRRFQMQFLTEQQGLLPTSRFLEIGYGPLTLGIPMISYLNPGQYTGIDVRENVTDIAYRQIAKHKLGGRNPRLIVSDDFGRAQLHGEKFDVVWGFSVLYHMSDEIVTNLFSQIPDRLTEGGRFWGNINTKVDDSEWLQFPFLRRSPDFYQQLAKQNGLQMTNHGPLHTLGFTLPGAERENILLEFARA